MKKIFAFLFLGFFVLGANAKTIKESVLIVATEGVYPPFSYYDEKNELTGYDVEVARAVAKKLNLQIEFLTAPWDAMLVAFNAGKADAVFNQANINEERKKKNDFSVPYTVSKAALIVRKDDESIKNFTDLKGKKSAHSPTSMWAKVAGANGAEIVSVDGFSKAVELIITRRADATVNDLVAYYDFLRARPNAPLKIAAYGDEPIYSAALLHKDNDELKEQIDRALGELAKQGVLSEISLKFFGADISK